MKSGNLSLLEASGPVQAFTGNALPLPSPLHNTARCLETAFYILTLHILIIHLFNLNNFSKTVNRLTIV